MYIIIETKTPYDFTDKSTYFGCADTLENAIKFLNEFYGTVFFLRKTDRAGETIANIYHCIASNNPYIKPESRSRYFGIFEAVIYTGEMSI